MGFWNWISGEAPKKTESKAEEAKPKKERKPRQTRLSEKERATKNKEPYIQVLDTHFNPQDPNAGYFELDWNVYFIDELRKAGYNGETDEEIIDKWFKNLCQNVLAEEQVNKVVRIT
jgi:hypothetical protein